MITVYFASGLDGHKALEVKDGSTVREVLEQAGIKRADGEVIRVGDHEVKDDVIVSPGLTLTFFAPKAVVERFGDGPLRSTIGKAGPSQAYVDALPSEIADKREGKANPHKRLESLMSTSAESPPDIVLHDKSPKPDPVAKPKVKSTDKFGDEFTDEFVDEPVAETTKEKNDRLKAEGEKAEDARLAASN
jgi:hypothetical protein